MFRRRLSESILSRYLSSPLPPAIVQLVRWVADDHVKLHFASKQLSNPSCDLVAVDKRIGVGLKPFTTIKGLLARTAVSALAIHPRVLGALKPDVAILAGEAFSNRVLAIGAFRAIQTPSR